MNAAPAEPGSSFSAVLCLATFSKPTSAASSLKTSSPALLPVVVHLKPLPSQPFISSVMAIICLLSDRLYSPVPCSLWHVSVLPATVCHVTGPPLSVKWLCPATGPANHSYLPFLACSSGLADFVHFASLNAPA